MQEPADHAAAEPWTWDPSLYAGTARYYAVGRVAYPAEADAPAAQVPLDGSGVLLDLGCGPGSMTLLLAPYVDRAVGVDPDPEMLAEAARQARRLGIGNVGWRQLRAEDLPADLAPPRLVFRAVLPLDGPARRRRCGPPDAGARGRRRARRGDHTTRALTLISRCHTPGRRAARSRARRW